MAKEPQPQQVTVTWGECLFGPIPYSSFRVGPFSMTVTVRDGETPEQAMARGHQHLQRHAEAEFKQKLQWFRASLHISREGT